MPETVNGRFLDSSANRAHFERIYRERIEDEVTGRIPGKDWKSAWRLTIEEIERSSENPAFDKKQIRDLRAEAGLPVWGFMM